MPASMAPEQLFSGRSRRRPQADSFAVTVMVPTDASAFEMGQFAFVNATFSSKDAWSPLSRATTTVRSFLYHPLGNRPPLNLQNSWSYL